MVCVCGHEEDEHKEQDSHYDSPCFHKEPYGHQFGQQGYCRCMDFRDATEDAELTAAVKRAIASNPAVFDRLAEL